jgi:hypothetical protein
MRTLDRVIEIVCILLMLICIFFGEDISEYWKARHKEKLEHLEWMKRQAFRESVRRTWEAKAEALREAGYKVAQA